MANSKGHSGVGFFLYGLVLWPIALVHALVIAKAPELVVAEQRQIAGVAVAAEGRVPCPQCAELILPNAKVCRFCKADLGVAQTPASGAAAKATDSPDERREPRLLTRPPEAPEARNNVRSVGGSAGPQDASTSDIATDGGSELPSTTKSASGQAKYAVLLVLAVAAVASYFTLTIFVVQPIGAAPQGRTLIIVRSHNLRFIDSADGFCQRTSGSVTLLCRGIIMAKVVSESQILLRLPYSETLYAISTGGRAYDR